MVNEDEIQDPDLRERLRIAEANILKEQLKEERLKNLNSEEALQHRREAKGLSQRVMRAREKFKYQKERGRLGKQRYKNLRRYGKQFYKGRQGAVGILSAFSIKTGKIRKYNRPMTPYGRLSMMQMPIYQQPTLNNTTNENPRDVAALLEEYKRQQQQQIVAENKRLSDSARESLQRLAQIQNLGFQNRVQQERRQRERRAIELSSSILKTPSLFKEDFNTMNKWLHEPEFDILQSPNVFRAENTVNIIQTGRPNILQTSMAGNSLNFFT